VVTNKIPVLCAILWMAAFGTQVNGAELAVEQTSNSNSAHPIASTVKTTVSTADSVRIVGAAGNETELKGGVSKTEVAPEELIDQLVQSAYSRDARAIEIQQKEDRYKGTVRRSIARVSDMAQFMTAYKGFQASSEAADVFLDEKQKLKSRAAVDWIKQKQHDELHPKVISALMQIASGLGMSDAAKQQKNIEIGVKQLSSIVGDDDAKRALTAMTAWAASVKDANLPVTQDSMSVLKLESATRSVVESSLQRDEIVLETKAKLHKYNHRSKVMQATAKVVNTSLSVAMFSPTFVSPAAQIALLAFLSVTGGPEEAKLLKEMYLDRRIECRYKMINQEATQAINNYNLASITGNSVLVQFCNLSANKMAGKDVLAQATADETQPDAVTSPVTNAAPDSGAPQAVTPAAPAQVPTTSEATPTVESTATTETTATTAATATESSVQKSLGRATELLKQPGPPHLTPSTSTAEKINSGDVGMKQSGASL
jgi:hypothetical protein